jgi:hypothetical protein
LLNLPNGGREYDQFEDHPQVRSSARGCSRRTVQMEQGSQPRGLARHSLRAPALSGCGPVQVVIDFQYPAYPA